jgi:hypothetical protein
MRMLRKAVWFLQRSDSRLTFSFSKKRTLIPIPMKKSMDTRSFTQQVSQMNSEKQQKPGEHRQECTKVGAKEKMLMLDVAIVNKLKILNMVVLAVFFHHFSWQR